MTRARHPIFRDLTDTDVQELLARSHVGRIAYSFHDRVDIEPIHYVFADGAFYMRTEPGSKLEVLAHAPWVAFEVDEVDGPLDWRSVVAHGTVYVLRDEGTPDARATYRAAVERIRELIPDALDTDDPVPARRVIIKLYPETLVGREARLGTRHAATAPRATSRAGSGRM
jgi:nitroimidazol reductase NimA-like FMN-containing flavoprotein (pyridoxamine 5'-phosphate oxidase superfamily)